MGRKVYRYTKMVSHQIESLKNNLDADFGAWMDGWETRRKRIAGRILLFYYFFLSTIVLLDFNNGVCLHHVCCTI